MEGERKTDGRNASRLRLAVYICIMEYFIVLLLRIFMYI